MAFLNPVSLTPFFPLLRRLKVQGRSLLAIGLGMSLSSPLLIIDSPVQASPLACSSKSPATAFSLPVAFPQPDAAHPDSIELWWAKEQLDVQETGLITNWFAMPDAQRVDIIVDRQRWTQLNYLERYRLVHQFATVAREHRYNLRIANQENQCLVAYWCDFEQTPYQCQMNFAATAESNLPVYQFQRGDFQLQAPPPTTEP